MSSTRLTRSETEKMVAGVCGGLATYLGIDVTLIRIGFVILTVASGVGIPLYLLLTIITPPGDDVMIRDAVDIRLDGDDSAELAEKNSSLNLSKETDNTQIVAYGLIGFGFLTLMSQFGFVSMSFVWPLLFIGVGVYFISKRRSDDV